MVITYTLVVLRAKEEAITTQYRASHKGSCPQAGNAIPFLKYEQVVKFAILVRSPGRKPSQQNNSKSVSCNPVIQQMIKQVLNH